MRATTVTALIAALCGAALLLTAAHARAQGITEGQGIGAGTYSSPYAIPWAVYHPTATPAASTAAAKDSELVVGAPAVGSHLQVGGPGVENGVEHTGKQPQWTSSAIEADDEGIVPRRGGFVGGRGGFVGGRGGFVGGGVARGTTVVHRGGAVVAAPGWGGYAAPLYGAPVYAEPVYAEPVYGGYGYGAPLYGGGGAGAVVARGGTTVVRHGAVRGGGVGFRRGFRGRAGGIGFADLDALGRAMDEGVSAGDDGEGIIPRHRGGFIGGAHGTSVSHRSGAVVATPGWRRPLHGGGAVVARGSSTTVRHGAVRGGAFRRGFGGPGIGFADLDAIGRAMDEGVSADGESIIARHRGPYDVDGVWPRH